jgi:hypothetical protein
VLKALLDRFWSKVQKTETCWLWTASKRHKGYGAFCYERNGIKVQGRAHRFSWELHFGEIPEGLFVLHRCDNPACVRPDHLFLGTNQDNVDDMMAKGRHVAGGARIGTDYKYRRGTEHHNAKLKPSDIQRIRQRRAAGDSYGKISREEQLSIGHVFRIVNKQAWRDQVKGANATH